MVGGARRPTKVLVTNVTNAEDVVLYNSYSEACKKRNMDNYSTVRRLAQGNLVLDGYRFSVVDEPAPQTVVPTAVVTAPVTQGSHEFTFFDDVDDLFKGQKVRFTMTEPKMVSVLDVIKIVTDANNHHMTWLRVQAQHPEVVTKIESFQFTGQGQQATPTADVATLIEIVNLLPGQRAASFRAKGAKILVRYLGGDETLVDEIRDNAAKIESAPEDSPLKMFELPEGSSSNAHRVELFSPTMEGKNAADFKGYCVYLIVFTYQGKNAIKLGWSKDFSSRVKDHERLYPDMKIWCIISCRNSECAQQTETFYKERMTSWIQSIKLPEDQKPDKQQTCTEIILNVTPEYAEEVLSKTQKDIDEEHVQNSQWLTSIEQDKRNHSLKDKELDIEREKLEVEKQKIEAEKLRIEVEKMLATNKQLELRIQMKQLGME